jgi:hypothetical protein
MKSLSTTVLRSFLIPWRFPVSGVCFAIILLFASLAAPAQGLVDLSKRQFTFTGRITNVWPFNKSYTVSLSDDYLVQKIAVRWDGKNKLQVVDHQYQNNVFFHITKGAVHSRIEVIGLGLPSHPAELQGADEVKWEGNTVSLKLMRDLTLEYGGNNKPTRLVKAGSWFCIVLK